MHSDVYEDHRLVIIYEDHEFGNLIGAYYDSGLVINDGMVI